MATVTIFDQDKKQVGEREIADAIFNTEVKGYLLHDMVRYQLAARRQGTAAVKSRAAVAGGGSKKQSLVDLAYNLYHTVFCWSAAAQGSFTFDDPVFHIGEHPHTVGRD